MASKWKEPSAPDEDGLEVSSDIPGGIRIDGRTLEGGGQLVRNALALSALTSTPVTIYNIRGNRKGKTGLKGSHTAAVRFLAEICGGEVLGASVGSSQITFLPRRRQTDAQDASPSTVLEKLTLNEPYIKPEYNIRQSTPGSIFLIFQAVYPYLLHAGARTYARCPIRLNVTGGTNVSFSPSYDYIAQVLVPNFAKLGLPHLSVDLHRRGWATGPLDIGSVTFVIYPLGCSPTKDYADGAKESSDERKDKAAGAAPLSPYRGISDLHHLTSTGSIPKFPFFNIRNCRRGTITGIDITILAPEIPLQSDAVSSDNYNRTARLGTRTTGTYTVRSYLQAETCRVLAHALTSTPHDLFPHGDHRIPIKIHTSEATGHRTRIYILLVGHTSTGFRLGRDALLGDRSDSGSRKVEGESGRRRARGGKGHSSHINSIPDGMQSRIQRLIDRCVSDFIDELSSPRFEGSNSDEKMVNHSLQGVNKQKPCVDIFMRDQVVVFEALGKLQNPSTESGISVSMGDQIKENEQDRSMHTQTAMWVCEKILGVKL